MLELIQATKHFGDKVAVDHLSLTAEPGKILGLIGQNGAGKTTTFRLILQFLNATEGEVRWEGKPITQMDVNEIGYLPEERGLYPTSTIEEQLLFFAELKGYPRKQLKQELDSWLEKTQVVGKKTDLVKSLSKGNQQKIQLLSTIIHRPKLLILDEPFSGLDPVNAEILKALIFDVKKQGSTIIFSSHRMENVEELCDAVLMLKNGKTVLYGATEEIKNSFPRTKIKLESTHSLEELSALQAVVSAEKSKGYTILTLNSQNDAPAVFDYVTKDGFIPTFTLEAPTLEEIFRWKVGEKDG